MQKVLKYIFYVILTFAVGLFVYFKLKHLKKQSLFSFSKKEKFIKVEVINCAGISKADREVVEFLRLKGFDVMKVVRLNKKIKKTYIVERYDINRENAKIVAKVLNCPNIEEEIDRDRIVKVSIVLGEDYKKYIPNVNKEEK